MIGMKMTSLFTLAGTAALLLLAGCKTAETGSRETSLELFDGKGLVGWYHILADPAIAREQVWSVQDGLLICQDTPLGVLYTKRAFTDFRFRLEYRWAPGTKPGNSGILTRINGPSRALPRTAEVQLMHGKAGDVLGLQGMQVTPGQPRYFEIMNHAVAGDIRGVAKLTDAERPGGEWNQVEVLARGGDYTVWMNGQKINQACGVEIVAGPIGLQSEGGEIHFRRVTVTPLTD